MKKSVALVAVGREIRRHRKAAGLSQQDLAERAGLHRNYVGFIERGERNPTAITLLQIADALTLSLGGLLGGVGRATKLG